MGGCLPRVRRERECGTCAGLGAAVLGEGSSARCLPLSRCFSGSPASSLGALLVKFSVVSSLSDSTSMSPAASASDADAEEEEAEEEDESASESESSSAASPESESESEEPRRSLRAGICS
jgi:hypothetical protein